MDSKAGLPKYQFPVVILMSKNMPNEIKSGIAPKKIAAHGYLLYPNNP
jgi:hypothetical protein